MGKKRHKILGKELYETPATTLQLIRGSEERYAKETAPGRPEQQYARERRTDLAVVYAVFEHLGYGPVEDLESQLNLGVDRSLEYFFGDWWRGDASDARRRRRCPY